MTTDIRLQISGSGGFSEPNNGLVLLPTELSPAGSAKLSIIPIPGTSSDVLQPAGSNAKRERLVAVSLGSWATGKVQKERALDNLIWHSTSASWQGRAVSVSLTIEGAVQESFSAFILNYSVDARRGKGMFDVNVDLVRVP